MPTSRPEKAFTPAVGEDSFTIMKADPARAVEIPLGWRFRTAADAEAYAEELLAYEQKHTWSPFTEINVYSETRVKTVKFERTVPCKICGAPKPAPTDFGPSDGLCAQCASVNLGRKQ